jgi:hypothetical protein
LNPGPIGIFHQIGLQYGQQNLTAQSFQLAWDRAFELGRDGSIQHLWRQPRGDALSQHAINHFPHAQLGIGPVAGVKFEQGGRNDQAVHLGSQHSQVSLGRLIVLVGLLNIPQQTVKVLGR